MTLDPVFVANLDAMLAHAVECAQATQNQGLRTWYLGNLDDWSGDPLDIAAIGDGFSRESVGEQYSQAIAGDGTAGEAASCSLQSDYLAAAERAFRIRHATPIRNRLHAAGRRLGHGHASAGSLARVRELAQDLLIAGGAGG